MSAQWSRFAPALWAFVAGLTFSAAALADVIGYWRFEDGSGAAASDDTGHFPGDLIGFDYLYAGAGDTGPTLEGWSTSVMAPLVPLTGVANTGSIRFGGASANVDLSTGQDMQLGSSFTIEFFMNPATPVIASPILGLSPISGLSLALVVDVGQLAWYSQFQGVPSGAPANLVQIGEWQHVAFVVEPSEYTIYVNGQIQFNGGIPEGGEGPFDFPGTGVTGDRSIGDGFRGYLDEFRISDTALTPDQFLIAIPEPSTVALIALAGCGLAVRSFRRLSRRGLTLPPV